MQQLQAGYILSATHQRLEEWATRKNKHRLALDGLLEWLGTFDIVTNLDLKQAKDVNPLLAVANNILNRGLPTLPSVWLEEQLAQSLKLTYRLDNKQNGSIEFPFNSEGPKGKDIFQAFHLIVPGLVSEASFYDTNDLDSDFERTFIFDYCMHQPALVQLLQKQRPLASLILGSSFGRVDFSLEIPYRKEHDRNNRFNRPVKLTYRKAYIAEIDGTEYHDQKVDSARDFATQAMGNHTSRITEDNAPANAEDFIERISKEGFVLRCIKNFANPNYGEEELTHLVLRPFAIARIQRLVLKYMLSGHWQAEQKNIIRLAVIERDIPAGELAIKDLKRTLDHLQQLAQEDYLIPDIELDCFTGSSELDCNAFDLVIDHSVLCRTGIFAKDRELIDKPNMVLVRTSHYVADTTGSAVISAQSIRYRDLVIRKDNEEYETHKNQAVIATCFLQDIFRKQGFRPGQLPILNRAFQRKSVIGLLPTGGGKSLTYQLAAMLQPGITIIVDPIRSLMVDQDRGLRKLLIDKTTFVNSSLTTQERHYAQRELLPKGRLQFLFVSPERFVIRDFRNVLLDCGNKGHYTVFVVIDEAHCVSEWGHDFRISYLNLGVNAQEYCPTFDMEPVPLFGLTATASYDVLADIERELQIIEDDGHAIVRFENTVRDEINYQIERVDARLEDGETPNPFNTKETIGKAKQEAVFDLIRNKQRVLERFNDTQSIRKTTHQSVTSYLGTNAQLQLNERASKNQVTAEEQYFSEKYERLHIANVQEAFQKTENGYNYGLVVFTPHKKGWLGILSQGVMQNADHVIYHSDDNLPYAEALATEDTLGFFKGSSNEDPLTARIIDQQSFAHMDRFLEGQNSVMIATKAFGMGIDKSNIRHTIHLNLPSSIESYVQEAGRAGRDGKLALSTVLFNDTKFLVDGKKLHVDADVLDYFHQRSFKGQMKEEAMVYELRNRVALPPIYKRHQIERELANLYPAYTEWKITPWEGGVNRRLYIDVAEVAGQNYVSLVNGSIRNDSLPFEVLQACKELIADAPIENLHIFKDWLNTLVAVENETTGIEKQFREMNIGEKRSLVVPFTNLYYSRESNAHEFQLNLKHLHFVANQPLLEELPQLSTNLEFRLAKAIQQQWSLEEFLRQFELEEVTRDRILDASTLDQNIRKFQRAYYAGRSSADTDKAVYRLSSIGVIDTYTIDYHNAQYLLDFTKQPEEQYFKNLESYVARYTSKRRAQKLVQELYDNNEETIKSGQATSLGICLSFLTNYIYDNIRLKRQRAIEDMLALCRNAVKIENPIEQNLFIKDEIYYYFNAKYSRPGLTEIKNGKEIGISLLDDIRDDELTTSLLIEKYLDVVEETGAGGFIDNIKHLRGSTMRLLRSDPDVPALMILKSYSLYILGNLLPSLLTEAKEELTTGMVRWSLHGNKPFDPGFFIDAFREKLSQHVDQYDLNISLQEALQAYYVDYYATWLHEFNNKLLEPHG